MTDDLKAWAPSVAIVLASIFLGYAWGRGEGYNVATEALPDMALEQAIAMHTLTLQELPATPRPTYDPATAPTIDVAATVAEAERMGIWTPPPPWEWTPGGAP